MEARKTSTHFSNDDRPSDALMSEQMSALLARNWWAMLLRGLIAGALGILILRIPDLSLGALALVFGAYVLADGALGLIAAMRAARRHERWGWLVLEGLLDLAAGIAALVWPGLTIIVLVALMAAWAIVTGRTMALAALRLQERHGRVLLGLTGVVGHLGRVARLVADQRCGRAGLVDRRLCAGARLHADCPLSQAARTIASITSQKGL